MDRFKDCINPIRVYLVYEAPRSLKLELRDPARVEVQRDCATRSYTARFVDCNLNVFGWGSRTERAIKKLFDEAEELYFRLHNLEGEDKLDDYALRQRDELNEMFRLKGVDERKE